MVQVFDCQGIEAVAGADRVEKVGGEHGVEADSLHFDAVPTENLVVVFNILSNFQSLRVTEKRSEFPEDMIPGKLNRRAGIAMADRNVECFVLAPGERKSHDIGFQRIEAGGLQVHGKDGCLPRARRNSEKS